MPTFKINKNKDFTVMSNYHLRDRNLSLKAKGLLSFMLSLPNNWDYSLKGLVAICKENKDANRSTLNELKQVYWDMNAITSYVQEEEIEEYTSDSEESKKVKKRFCILK